jgi:hypothetical protein
MKTLLRVILGIAVTGLAMWVIEVTKIPRSARQLEMGAVSPSLALTALWVVFLTRYRGDDKRISAWLALLFTSISGIAALWAVAHLNELQHRSRMDMTYENVSTTVAAVGWVAALVWFARSSSLCAVGTMLTAFWVFFVFSLSY